MRGDDVKKSIDKYRSENPDRDICAIVATAGTTNLGIIDELPTVGAVANKHKIWFHVDGAYGLAGLASEETRKLFDGIETPIHLSSIPISGSLLHTTSAHLFTGTQRLVARHTLNMRDIWMHSRIQMNSILRITQFN